MKKTRVGIIICNRYRRCAGGKCFLARSQTSRRSDVASESNVSVRSRSQH